MISALDIRFLGTLLERTHSWVTTFLAATETLRARLMDRFEAMGFDFDTEVDLSAPHKYINIQLY